MCQNMGAQIVETSRKNLHENKEINIVEFEFIIWTLKEGNIFEK